MTLQKRESILPIDLLTPDPVGRDLALYRTRVYRFTDDPKHYILAEQLEERYLAGIQIGKPTLAYVRDALEGIRQNGQVLEFDTGITADENIDIVAELRSRRPFRYLNAPRREPTSVLAIIGAPRSGTSHLYNLLARTGQFAYFTTVSCWAWPIRNLTRPRRRLFTTMATDVLDVDNKNTRLIPGLVMPYEAEDVYARSIPAYRHIARHRYELTPVYLKNLEILTQSTAAHLDFFKSRVLLTKSPFNSLRIPELEGIWHNRIRYVHIKRDQVSTADSMRRNHFEFIYNGKLLSAEDVWDQFVDTIRSNAPPDRSLDIEFASLLNDPQATLEHIINWAQVVNN